MSENDLSQDRKSTRLAISIPIVISGVDADGSHFSDGVRTVIVNKHGAKISTARHLTMGTEVQVENPALGIVAKASVAWLSEKHYSGTLHHVGLQLHEAQNVWGVAFPPDDWSLDPPEGSAAAPDDPQASEQAGNLGGETRVPSLAGEEITIRLLQELQESADAHTRDFQDRLKQLSHRLGLELELDLRERAATLKTQEMASLEEEIRGLRENLRVSKEGMGKLEAQVQELQGALKAALENVPPPTPLDEARLHLATLTNSVVENMNRAAEVGLSEYRSLLQKENLESAARLRPRPEKKPPPPGGPSPQS